MKQQEISNLNTDLKNIEYLKNNEVNTLKEIN